VHGLETGPSTTTAPPPAPVDVPDPAPPAIDPRRLAAEVALIDRARAAIASHDSSRALALLDEHRRTFSDGALVAEAEFVRIEALVGARRTAEATELGRAFLTRFPRSPLGRRVRDLILTPN
jgi:hypothetical protein